MRWLVVLVLGLVACGSDTVRNPCDVFRGAIAQCGWGDAAVPPPACNPLTQTGCDLGQKCTWIIDQTTPQYVGHIGCTANGTAAVGSVCQFGAPGATGFDDCAKGSVCSGFGNTGTAGICKQICDNSGGDPMCDDAHACVGYSKLFSTGALSPAAAGVCDPACDPLDDNDFDGSGSALARTGTTCGSNPRVGCYGAPSLGTPPRTAFSCSGDFNYGTPLHHRSECTAANRCADPDGTIYINSCNQGYEPLVNESTAVSTQVCVAFCKPLDCYAGNCGSNDANRIGAAPHRCANPDALGSFGSGEECEYLWREEIDGSGHWLASPTSDSVGICVDHDAYGLPRCEDLPLQGSGSALGAADLGCVSSQLANPPMLRRRFVTDVRLSHE